jgi:hypothetical protein
LGEPLRCIKKAAATFKLLLLFYFARVGLFAPSPSRFALGGSAAIPLALRVPRIRKKRIMIRKIINFDAY